MRKLDNPWQLLCTLQITTADHWLLGIWSVQWRTGYIFLWSVIYFCDFGLGLFHLFPPCTTRHILWYTSFNMLRSLPATYAGGVNMRGARRAICFDIWEDKILLLVSTSSNFVEMVPVYSSRNECCNLLPLVHNISSFRFDHYNILRRSSYTLLCSSQTISICIHVHAANRCYVSRYLQGICILFFS